SFTLDANGTAMFRFGWQAASGAATIFNGGTMHGDYDVLAGSLKGSPAGSTILGSLSNSGGTIDPGGTTGTLTVTGDYTQTAGILSVAVNRDTGANGTLAVGGM